MSSLPDAARPWPAGHLTLYPPADRVGPYTAVPDQLRIMASADGRPDLQVEVVRSFGVRLLQYGVVDLRVSAAADLDAAAGALAEAGLPPAVEQADWESLAVRLVLPSLDSPQGDPAPPDGVGLGVLRVTRRVEPAVAALLDELLTAGTVPLDVVMEAVGGATEGGGHRRLRPVRPARRARARPVQLGHAARTLRG